jgi:hypothetical protein
MTELSPNAMAVLDAFLNGCICNSTDNAVAFQADRNGLAAALRALADQVLEDWNEETYDKILAIATELENQP